LVGGGEAGGGVYTGLALQVKKVSDNIGINGVV